MEDEEKVEEWELLPPNTSFLELGLEDIKDLFSKEIDYADYFIEQPAQLLNLSQSANGDEEPSQQSTASKRQSYDEEFQEEIEVEDLQAKEQSSDDEENEVLGEKPRPIVAGIGEMLSIGAAVAAAMLCGFLLGSGRRKEQPRRADTMRFHIYKDDKALKQMVRQANRINQVLVATASGMPPPVMQPATISFGGCFGDML
ncbi:uncharacterized protein LOC110095473 [Dendrobium catenatum]|uniref:DUF6821 domain-containing protein n=1 Tax=Dendrobium catenatum TaxID=906689 RepID=A0A2I0X3H6_9ASPA|nr:uncharacterized protein LOC110095473 [Dendrobium catenatum]PKU82465.1 hypothetical protein MA16_Dca005470 [Dendrobium catenatum]